MTKLPWKVTESQDNLDPGKSLYRIDPHVATMYHLTDEGRQNAEYIVRACNHYPKLMEIVEHLQAGRELQALQCALAFK
jgi:hypothetical protein